MVYKQERIQEVADRGASESLILASWRKVEEWRPPPTAANLAPLKFSSQESLRAPLFVLEWRPIRHLIYLFLSFFPFLSLFSSCFFSFRFLFLLFWRPFIDPGGPKPPKPPPQDTPLMRDKEADTRRNSNGSEFP